MTIMGVSSAGSMGPGSMVTYGSSRVRGMGIHTSSTMGGVGIHTSARVGINRSAAMG